MWPKNLDGMAIEKNMVVWSATQYNRSGMTNSDPEMDATSDSIGLPMALDLFLAIIKTEEFDALGQRMIKNLKNRYKDEAYIRRFMVGIDKRYQRIFEVENNTENLMDTDEPVFDGGKVIEREKTVRKPKTLADFGLN